MWASQVVLEWLKKKKKNLPANSGDIREADLIPGSGRSPEEGMTTHSLPGNSYGQRSLAGYNPQRKVSDMTEAT